MLTLVKEIKVHLESVHTLYIRLSTNRLPLIGRAKGVCPSPGGLPPGQVVEIRGKWPYDNSADEFVRPCCREQAGWRRDEWAYSPLFIWGERPLSKGTTRGGHSGSKTAEQAASLNANSDKQGS
jgi:hypothetical protein